MKDILSKLKQIFLSDLFFWIIFIFVSLLVVIPTLSGSKLNLPYKLFAVESGSMEPTIKVGDLITVKTKNSTYEIGDIITFKYKGLDNKANNTHRIVDIHINEDGSKEYITKGDFNSVRDVEPVTDEKIIGKYVFRIPIIGYLILFIQTVPGLILLIVMPSTILIYEEVKKIKEEVNRRKQYLKRNSYQK